MAMYQQLDISFTFVGDNSAYSITLDLTKTIAAFAQSSENFIGEDLMPDAVILNSLYSEGVNLMEYVNCTAVLSNSAQQVTISSVSGTPFGATTTLDFTLNFNLQV